MRTVRKVARGVMAGVAVATASAGLVALGPSSPAMADSCPAARDVYIDGGESHYTLACSGGKVYVDGRVKDTESDGYCVRVKALIDGTWYYSNKACPNGETEYFSWSGPGSTASVYTYKE